MYDHSDPYIDLPRYDYVWTWKPSSMRPMNRKGHRCRILVYGRMNSIMIEFEDGYRVVCSRNAVRLFKSV